jgi:hypothetical protein
VKKLASLTLSVLTLTLLIAFTSLVPASNKSESEQALESLRSMYPHVLTNSTNGHIAQLYGRDFGHGSSPENAAESFRISSSKVFGAESGDLLPIGPTFDQRHTQPVMYDPTTGDYKFTLVYYSQFRDGIPVFESDLRLLVRNEPGYPIVLANSRLKNLGDFTPHYVSPLPHALSDIADAAGISGLTSFSETETVIWAGGNPSNGPRPAIKFTGSDEDRLWLFIVDGDTGELLYSRDLISRAGLEGNVSGYGTP